MRRAAPFAAVLAVAIAAPARGGDTEWRRTGVVYREDGQGRYITEDLCGGKTNLLAENNHRAVGRLLVVVYGRRPAGEPFDDDLRSAVLFLEESKLDWIVALRKAAYLVRGDTVLPEALGRVDPKLAAGAKPAIWVVETDGTVPVLIPLPAKDEEIADKLRGRVYRRSEPDPAAAFNFGYFSFRPPEGLKVADVGSYPEAPCVLAGPDGRRAYVGECGRDTLGSAEAGVRESLGEGKWGEGQKAQKLSPARPQYATSKSQSGTFAVSFATENDEKGAGHFELMNGNLFSTVVVGKGASDKEARSLLACFKEAYKTRKR